MSFAAAAAHAGQRVELNAAFSPNRLGAATTIEFGFHVSGSTAMVPSPVVGVDLYLPAGMGLVSSTLGLAVCQPARLLTLGLEGCPANARVGYGTAVGELSAGGEVVEDAATVQSVLGPNIHHHEQILFYVRSNGPVSAELIFSGELLPAASAAFSSHLDTSVPVVPAWPNGPYVAVTNFSSTLGPRGLTYYRHVGDAIVPFRPKGISVPSRCPAGGFPFLATLSFLDGSSVKARHLVPCPAS